ncbi:MAG: C4-dicarboxylate TRAP transporter substrate-binding protein [Rhizobiaceae bacterium]|nr:C4-dicarboxylate TRAP transporter substrate-binding protein [Rhizobiaceae bacterium]|tara:strand:+ start:285258 stop:286232 length:975 start_codon:yes stop_codon:yes gene_type:complete
MNALKFFSAVSVLTVALCGTAMAADYTLSVNTALTQDDPLFKGLEAFRDNVSERTDGTVEIKIFPSSQLGKDEDVLEQARAGAPVAVVVDGGRLAVFQKEFGVLGAPFLASGYDGIRKVVTSDLFEEWVAGLHDSSGLQVLSFNWWQGERHLLTKKPITGTADLAGVRMRTPGAPVWMETIRAMGATPTPMGWTEVYSALQQGVIDAAEAQHPATRGSKLDEVVTHITKTGHINLITGLVGSAAWFDSLPAETQVIIREEALKAGDIASYGTQDALAGIEKELTEKGVIITEIDTAPFKEATAPVYDLLGYGDLRDTLRAIAAQ